LALLPHHLVEVAPRLLVLSLALQQSPPPDAPADGLGLGVVELPVPVPHAPHVVAPVLGPVLPLELAIPVLQPLVEVAHIPAFGRGQHPLPLELIVVEGSLVDIARVLEYAVLLGAVLEAAFEVVVVALLLSLPVECVVLEVALEEDGGGHVDAFAVAPAVLDLALVVVAVGVDEAAVAVRDARDEGALVDPTRRVVVAAEPVRLAVQPLPFVHHARPAKPEVLVGLTDSPLRPQPAVALLLDGLLINTHLPRD